MPPLNFFRIIKLVSNLNFDNFHFMHIGCLNLQGNFHWALLGTVDSFHMLKRLTYNSQTGGRIRITHVPNSSLAHWSRKRAKTFHTKNLHTIHPWAHSSQRHLHRSSTCIHKPFIMGAWCFRDNPFQYKWTDVMCALANDFKHLEHTCGIRLYPTVNFHEQDLPP